LRPLVTRKSDIPRDRSAIGRLLPRLRRHGDDGAFSKVGRDSIRTGESRDAKIRGPGSVSAVPARIDVVKI
jgi:hypothetical protein